jgi:deoxyhypusine synthase
VITPLIGAGFIDYISSTGANLYHDLHFDLGLPLYRGGPSVSTGALDVKLREDGVIRVYDVLFPADVLYKTDEWLMRVMLADEFDKRMGTAELHNRLGRYAMETARKTGSEKPSILATCHQHGVPVYSPSPGDSTIGLNFSAIHTYDAERGPHVDPAIDVAEMAALVLDAKRGTGKGATSAVVIFGGGAPKNFLLQTEPQLQEILGISESGHDYFVQFTDARPRHRRPVGRHAGRGGELGQDRPRQAARRHRRLRRFDDRHAHRRLVPHGQVQATQAAPPLRQAARGHGQAAHRIPGVAALQALLRQAQEVAAFFPDCARRVRCDT